MTARIISDQDNDEALGEYAGCNKAMRRIRVAALIDTAIVSGPGRQLAALAGKLKLHNVDLCVFMFQRRGRSASPYIAYLQRAEIPCIVLPDNGPFDVGLIWRLKTALREWGPDIVQTHNYRTTALAYALRALGGSPWKWIAFFHGDTRESWRMALYNKIDQTLLPRADMLVVMSQSQQRKFAHARPDTRIIYNAVIQLPVHERATDLAPYRRPEVPMLGVIGRLSYEKGVDVLLSAISHLPFEASLIIAGDGPEQNALRAQAADLSLSSRVHFLGTVANVASLYKQLDLVVLPSRSEGLPNVLLEAIAANVAVVATDVGAVAEVLSIPGSGEIVQPEDSTSLAQAIQRALVDGQSPAASTARACVADRFSLKSRVEAHLNLYANALK